MSAITAILTLICLVDLPISAQGLQAAESIGNQGELFAKKNLPQISQRFQGSSKSSYGQGSYGGSSYGVGGSGRSSYVGSSYRSRGYERPGYEQFVYESSYGRNGYSKGESYGHRSYGVGNYGKLGLSDGGYEQSTHDSYGGEQIPSYGGDYVGASHVESDSPPSELSIKGIAKEYIINFLTNAIRRKGTSGSAAEHVGSAHLSDYESFEAPVIPVLRGLYSYPFVTPQFKQGSRLLYSGTPSSHFVPCSSYPSYGRY